MRAGSSAARSTPATSASTGTSRRGRGDKVAYLWEGEPGDTRSITYAELLEQVCRFANALRGLGVKRGDRVGIYMGMVPELPVAMLACARIGAAHSVVFGGFSAEAVADRMNDSGSVCLITQDEAWRRGTTVPLKKQRRRGADQDARRSAPSWWCAAPATTCP